MDDGDQATSADVTVSSPASAAWDRLEDQLSWYGAKSTACQHAFKSTKLVELVVAAAVPVLAALSSPAAVTASFAAVVVVLEGIVQLYQWQTNWVTYRATAEALKHERYLYLAQAGPYVGPNRHRVLAERVEGLVSQEHAKWTEARSHETEHSTEAS